MANVKRVSVTGYVPFNTNEHEDLNKFLGHLNGPSFGLSIHYPGYRKMVGNQYGGQTTMFEFEVSGEEAVRPEYIVAFMNAVTDAGGWIEGAKCRDIEASEDINLNLY